jgi:hypothetical protein
VPVIALRRVAANIPSDRRITKDRVLLGRQEKCREAIVIAVAVAAFARGGSQIMFRAIARPTGCLLFRACVTLRRILAAKKRPLCPRIRKAALLALVYFAACGSIWCAEAAPVTDAIRPIHDVDASILPPAGELPPDLAAIPFAQAPIIAADSLTSREWLNYAYFWQAPALCHGPLYFEEPNLERYGHRSRFLTQPFLSGAHFFSAVPALPFKMALNRPFNCRYTLGNGRPGGYGCWQPLR